MSLDAPPPSGPLPGDAGPVPPVRLPAVAAGSLAGAFQLRDWALLLGVAFTWGASFLLIDIGLDAFSPYLVAFARVALAAAALALLPRSRGRVAPGDWPRIAFLSAIWMALPLTLIPLAEQHISSALAGMLNGAMPIMTAVVATVLGLRRPGPIQLVGLGAGFIGVALISVDSFVVGGDQAFGALLVLGAVACYSVSVPLAVPLQQRYGAPTLALRVTGLAALFTAPAALVWGLPASHFAWRSLLAVATLGVVGTGVAFAVMSSLLGRVGATRGSIATYLMPPVAMILGVVVRGDRIPPIAVVGIAVVLLSAVLVSRKDG